ncbi:MAG: glycoside hydrolase N-terminal domain-containing protein [Eubacteriales bacterium]|nr:glycoside hydrolase N-terminal domain-containing protein [Eubacteriales bacterium]
MSLHTLWYRQPARIWEEALPLGNGIIGAMVFGGIDRDRIQLNEETLWSGYQTDNENPQCAAQLENMRQLIFNKNYKEAQSLCNRYLVCGGKGSKGSGETEPYGSYQTAGDLYIEHKIEHKAEDKSDYRRSLDIFTGIADTFFGDYKSTYFVSYDYNVIVIRLSGYNEIKIHYERNNTAITYDCNSITAAGRINNKYLSYAISIKTIRDKDDYIIYITAATDYSSSRNPEIVCKETIERAEKAGYETILKAHNLYFKPIMDRVSFSLNDSSEELAALPTDKHIRKGADKSLAELYFQYGRYLLLSSSRGVLPANLQGIWNKDYIAPWSADYHININIQMNYWPAEVTDLPETLEPFFDYIEMLARSGTFTAERTYNKKGWVAHTITNPWGFTAPGEHPSWGAFMCAGAWCCRHLWEHYLYTCDKEFLSKYYPVIRGSAEFFFDFLVRDPNTGYLVTAPSNSPENSFIDPETGEAVAMCASPTMDNMILYELFTITAECAAILGIDSETADKALQYRAELPPLKIGKHGQIMEWLYDFEEAEPGHRHMSNLYGLHPAAIITENKSPEFMEAARVSIARRLANGGGHTGWSRAWIINFFARLHDSDSALENLYALIDKSTLDNMFDNHPPFQIDGNFGGCAGIAEMLIQSHDGFIDILPALPGDWDNGSYTGLVARGGFIVDTEWREGDVIFCKVISKYGNDLKIKINNKIYEMTTEKNTSYIIT